MKFYIIQTSALAEFKVKNQGFEYCPKNIWKTEVRNVAPKSPNTGDKPKKRKKSRGDAIVAKKKAYKMKWAY